MKSYHLTQGTAPILISLPHIGTRLTDEIREQLTDDAKYLPDTDWHLGEIYDFFSEIGASIITPIYSRYVIDLNRSNQNENLYPGKNSTGLCPATTFMGAPLYKDASILTEGEIQSRIYDFWTPYHQALQDELNRLKSIHRHVLLWEGHSIASELPFLFEGQLPAFNFGTADGKSCDGRVLASVLDMAKELSLDYVANQRFKGGFITRNYGSPENNIHAIQLEMSQRIYMSEQFPYALNSTLAPSVKRTLKLLIEAAQQSLSII
ncbi:N-formylglutamate deformylase [Leeia sp. TBRC 13508]|uniref:N-formylglutamate deformylase n=1 Tax=Leeia speluncae TaxID=2884804 RepID=A0ABS8D9S7_9NEIS|nr:N-formylglutamate deformylase [Leeia speluncae]MCB6184965.1 N-formylglutamate deformylase [Leeia speluncae]